LKQIRRVDVCPSEFEVLLVEEFRMSGLARMFSTWFKLTENSLWGDHSASSNKDSRRRFPLTKSKTKSLL